MITENKIFGRLGLDFSKASPQFVRFINCKLYHYSTLALLTNLN